MKGIQFSQDFVKKIKKIRSNNELLCKRIKQQLLRFQIDPQHPSLRTHKLIGKLQKTWSISIDKNYRMLYRENDFYYFFDLGTHDQVYRK